MGLFVVAGILALLMGILGYSVLQDDKTEPVVLAEGRLAEI